MVQMPGNPDSIAAQDPALLQQVRFVLVEPSRAGNIGACARAMRSMGLERLCVVRPLDANFRDAPEARAFAASASDVLAQAASFDTLAQALGGVHLALATTGYAREFGPEPMEVRAAARHAAALAGSEGAQIAFVFGTERTGLANQDVQRCHLSCAIPADPQRGSLNLAQAAQVVAYECRRAFLDAAGCRDDPPARRDHSLPQPRAADPPAGIEQTEAMFAHLEEALVAVGYLDPDEPRHLMARLRRLLLRARPSATEVDVVRGIASAMILPRALRAGKKTLRGRRQ